MEASGILKSGTGSDSIHAAAENFHWSHKVSTGEITPTDMLLLRRSPSLSLLAGFFLLACSISVNAQWIAVPLNSGTPDVNSVALATDGSRHGGTVGSSQVFPWIFSANDSTRGVTWTGFAAPQLVQLDAPSYVRAIRGELIGGAILAEGSVTAALWNTTTGALLNLHPNGYSASQIIGLSATHQVGTVVQDGRGHAGIWSGSAESFVDLHPAGAAASGAGAVHGHRQGGLASFAAQDGFPFHAALWSGSAASFINLNPPGSTLSEITALTETYEAGYAYFNGVSHAGLWFGTADSFVSLHPGGDDPSVILAVAGDLQAGFANDHAAVWQGSAASCLDLHESVLAALGAGFDRSAILGGAVDESGHAVFVGYAYNPSLNLYQAMLWTNAAIPEPATYSALFSAAVLVIALGAGRRRRPTLTEPRAPARNARSI